ncbi:MAG TPA: hypothetical protein VD902_03985 [Symbiobacteriaceae bacterium]|nr:hypothetical protein [Symbiobacteriaceae bacterium]
MMESSLVPVDLAGPFLRDLFRGSGSHSCLVWLDAPFGADPRQAHLTGRDRGLLLYASDLSGEALPERLFVHDLCCCRVFESLVAGRIRQAEFSLCDPLWCAEVVPEPSPAEMIHLPVRLYDGRKDWYSATAVHLTDRSIILDSPRPMALDVWHDLRIAIPEFPIPLGAAVKVVQSTGEGSGYRIKGHVRGLSFQAEALLARTLGLASLTPKRG